MTESDRLSANERKEAVLLEARQALLVILGYQPARSKEELAKIKADYFTLIEKNPWLEEPMGFRGDQEITLLSELSRSLVQAFGKEDS